MLGTAALPAPWGMGGVWMAGVPTFGVDIIDIEKVLRFFFKARIERYASVDGR
jgi:hypothetical protein